MQRSLNNLNSVAGLFGSILQKPLNLADIPNPAQARSNLGILGSINVQANDYLTISSPFDTTTNQTIGIIASSNGTSNTLVAYDGDGGVTGVDAYFNYFNSKNGGSIYINDDIDFANYGGGILNPIFIQNANNSPINMASGIKGSLDTSQIINSSIVNSTINICNDLNFNGTYTTWDGGSINYNASLLNVNNISATGNISCYSINTQNSAITTGTGAISCGNITCKGIITQSQNIAMGVGTLFCGKVSCAQTITSYGNINCGGNTFVLGQGTDASVMYFTDITNASWQLSTSGYNFTISQAIGTYGDSATTYKTLITLGPYNATLNTFNITIPPGGTLVGGGVLHWRTIWNPVVPSTAIYGTYTTAIHSTLVGRISVPFVYRGETTICFTGGVSIQSGGGYVEVFFRIMNLDLSAVLFSSYSTTSSNGQLSTFQSTIVIQLPTDPVSIGLFVGNAYIFQIVDKDTVFSASSIYNLLYPVVELGYS